MSSPVVVVGSGLAGLTVAYRLLERDIPVIILEKTSRIGGNSIKASSGINGINTITQHNYGVNDSFNDFYKDVVRSSGDGLLQRTLVNESQQAIDWLQRDIGVTLDIVNQLGGHSEPRTHRSDNISPGYEIISKLKQKLDLLNGKGLLELRLDSKLIDITKTNGYSVEYSHNNEVKKINTNNIVLATGGFGYNKQLIQKYKPEFINLSTTNGVQTMGEGQLILERLGGELIDMEQIQIHPTGFISIDDPLNNFKFLAAESLRGIGGVLINTELDRFVNELSTRDVVSQAILKQPGGKSYLVLSHEMYLNFQYQMDFYLKMKLLSKVKINERFDEKDSDKLVRLLKGYLEGEDEFGRMYKADGFNVSGDDYIYIGEVTPVVHFTMGGVKINVDGQVLQKDSESVIPGLYAVGEVSGGVHGRNRLGGNSLLECIVFGTRAGNTVKH